MKQAADAAAPRATNGAKQPAKPVAAAAQQPKRGVVGRMQAAIATAFKQEPEWKEF
jgi:hypothetical protein